MAPQGAQCAPKNDAEVVINMSPKSIQMVAKWRPKVGQNGIKMMPKLGQNGTQHGLIMGPACPIRNGPSEGRVLGWGVGSQVGVLWRSKRGPGGAGTGVKSENASGSHPSRDLCELKSIFPSNLAPQTHQNTLEFHAQMSFLLVSISRSRFDRF